MKKGLLILLACAITGLALWQFWSAKAPAPVLKEQHDHDASHEHSHENIVELTKAQIHDLGIEVIRAGPVNMASVIATRGKLVLHPDKLVHVLPKIPGVAKEAYKNIGDTVSAGERLAVLESREMADIKANYLAAKEKQRLALTLLEREKQLYEKKVSAQQDYINAQSAYTEAKIAVQLNTQKLRSFGLEERAIEELGLSQSPDLRLYEIDSPIHGVVIARHINRGEFVETTTTIYEIVDLSTIWIEIGIYPKDLIKVKEGQVIDVTLPTNLEHAQAKIIYLSPIIQDETITAKAVAELKKPSRNWRPGSFVKVDIAEGEELVPIGLPKEALTEIKGKPVVFVRTAEGFEKREVKLGGEDRRAVQIVSGLDAGEEVAVTKVFLLKAELGKAEAEHTHG